MVKVNQFHDNSRYNFNISDFIDLNKQEIMKKYRKGKDNFRKFLFMWNREICLPTTMEKLLKVSEVVEEIYNNHNFIPRTLEICPTNKCNLQCPTCIDKNAMNTINNELSKKQIINGIKSAIKLGIPSFKFAGFGEPTLKVKEVVEAYKLIGKLGLPVSMITNGVDIHDDLIEVIVKYGTEYRVSIPTHVDDIYNKLTGPKNPSMTASSVIKQLKKIIKMRNSNKRSNLLIGVSILIYPINFKTINEFIELLIKIGVDYIMVKPTLTDGDAIGIKLKGTSFYKNLEKIKKLSTLQTAIFLTIERFTSAQYGRNYRTCRVAGIAPMILSSIEKGQATLWTCGRGKGRKGFELKSLNNVPVPHDTSLCPPVCKEDAYNLGLQDKWLKRDIISRSQLPNNFSINMVFHESKNLRVKYLKKRFNNIYKSSGVSYKYVKKLLQDGLIVHHLIYSKSIKEIFDINSLDDIIVFGIYLHAEKFLSDKLYNVYKTLSHTRHRTLAPQRLENIYSFF